MTDVYIVAATRTPIGKFGRAFKDTRGDDLLIKALQGAMSQVPQLSPELIEDAVFGCATPEGEQGLNIARCALVTAGWPVTVPGITVNRLCASGLSAIQIAADRIRVGECDLMLAGGVESMSHLPLGGRSPSLNPAVFDNPTARGLVLGMGLTAENLARDWAVSREEQDAFSYESHRRAIDAQNNGYFGAEITSVETIHRLPDPITGAITLHKKIIHKDEGPRTDTSLAVLAKLKPAFQDKGTVTAGNSSQISDGASVLVLASEAAVMRYKLQPLVRLMGFQYAGVDPATMGLGPVSAVPKLLKRHGLTIDQLDWIELNEAFAAQVLAVQQHLHFNPERLNPMGGAIALGHPLGASGAIRTCTALYGLKRLGGRYGLVTMCVGMGQGAALLLEQVS
jgi:acetyl-CoA acyltransferase